MSNIIKKKHDNKAVEIAEIRTAWHERQKHLTDQLEVLGLNQDTIDTFDVKDSSLSHERLSEILYLKRALQEQEDQRKVLWVEEDTVKELNEKHAAVHTDQFYILTEKRHPVFGAKDFTLESKESFKSVYEPYQIICTDGKERSKAVIWLRSPQRRSYNGIIFEPSQGNATDNFYNIWKGFAKEPKQGNASRYWDHVRNNICNNNEDAYRYVRKWMAAIVQRPDEIHTALVLCGSQGVAKNSFVEPLGVLFGSHYVLLSSLSELISNFNFHLKNAVLIHANEALWGGNRKEIGTLKAMITEKTCLIEGKGKDRIMVKNFKHMILSSNESWPVHLDRDDRRFFVLQVSETHKEDHVYFAAIQEELNNGGYEALLYDLLNEDLGNFNLRKLPHSKASFDIKMQGQDSSTRYLFAALQNGHFSIGDEIEGCWQDELPKNQVYKDYVKWCLNNEEKKQSNSEFGKALSKLLPSIGSKRSGGNSSRVNVYTFPGITVCKKDFCRAFNELDNIFESFDEENENSP